ncbi:MAG: manganese efflux pump [Candidatus Coatesbacteria bacterium]|nr:manganese efflux pump [Candidatus Coatesbacteria bacterium]
MDIVSIILLGIALSMDCFSVSIATGIIFQNMKIISKTRIVVSFAIAHSLMTVIGYNAGRSIVESISGIYHWIAFLLLFAIGSKMIYEAWKNKIEEIPDPSSGWLLLALTIATSIDNLAAGFNLAISKVDIIVPSILFGLIVGIISIIGLMFGQRLGKQFGRKMLILGGLILMGLGLRILISHFMKG